jgi:molybdopterin converting factor small subunit
MPRVTVELPSLLAPMANGERTIAVDAETVAGALAALVAAHPALDVHLFSESRDLRPHVLCFHNDVNTRWLEGRDAPLRDGDVLSVIQAVSGG